MTQSYMQEIFGDCIFDDEFLIIPYNYEANYNCLSIV